MPLWSTFAYSVNAFLLWGGGWWAGKGALDYSGGYVIHLAAGTTGFVAAAVIGPRLGRGRARAVPNNLPLAAVECRDPVVVMERIQRRRPLLRGCGRVAGRA